MCPAAVYLNPAMDCAQTDPSTQASDFEVHWQRLLMLLEEPTQAAIQFVFSGNDELLQALLTRLQQGALRRDIDCLLQPENSDQRQAGDTSAAEGIVRACLARILPTSPLQRPRLLLLDLHQGLARVARSVSIKTSETPAEQAKLLDDVRALLLSRLNERRAQLLELGPLLLILPENWTKPAAQYAPDLWTKRLSSLYLAPPPFTVEENDCASSALAEAPTASLRPGHAAILARWQQALASGNARNLPVADGWLAAQASLQQGRADEAETIARLALEQAYCRGSVGEQMTSQSLLGDIYLRRGKTARAAEAYASALHLAQQRASADANNSKWQRDLSVSYDKVADILRRSDPAAALVNYQASLDIAQELARREPDNSEWQRDLSVSYNKVADILRRSDPAAAFVNYQASLDIRQELARREPDNFQAEVDQVISYVKLATLHPTVSPADARAYLQAALDTALSLQQRGLLGSDQKTWPTDIRERLEALPPT